MMCLLNYFYSIGFYVLIVIDLIACQTPLIASSLPPQTFPNNTNQFKIQPNETAREILVDKIKNENVPSPPLELPENATNILDIPNSVIVKKILGKMNNSTVDNPVTPPTVFPQNSTTFKILNSTNETLRNHLEHIIPKPPVEFPANNSDNDFHVLKPNRTVIEKLDHVTKSNSTVKPSEVNDMLSGKDYNGDQDVDPPEKTLPLGVVEEDKNRVNTDIDKELINGTQNTPTEVHQQYFTINVYNKYSGKTGYMRGKMAAIMASVFVGIVIIAYLGLVFWRRRLELLYGNRELLVNETDDFEMPDHRFRI